MFNTYFSPIAARGSVAAAACPRGRPKPSSSWPHLKRNTMEGVASRLFGLTLTWELSHASRVNVRVTLNPSGFHQLSIKNIIRAFFKVATPKKKYNGGRGFTSIHIITILVIVVVIVMISSSRRSIRTHSKPD